MATISYNNNVYGKLEIIEKTTTIDNQILKEIKAIKKINYVKSEVV